MEENARLVETTSQQETQLTESRRLAAERRDALEKTTQEIRRLTEENRQANNNMKSLQQQLERIKCLKNEVNNVVDLESGETLLNEKTKDMKSTTELIICSRTENKEPQPHQTKKIDGEESCRLQDDLDQMITEMNELKKILERREDDVIKLQSANDNLETLLRRKGEIDSSNSGKTNEDIYTQNQVS